MGVTPGPCGVLFLATNDRTNRLRRVVALAVIVWLDTVRSLACHLGTEDSVEALELRPLSLGEILDRTFRLYRNHFWLFVSIMAIPAAFSIPANVLLLSFQGSMMNAAALAPDRPPSMPSPGIIVSGVVGYFLFFLIFGTVYWIAVAASSSAVADVYLGRACTVRGSYARISGRFWRLIGIVFNVALRLFGLFLLVVIVLGGGIAAIGYFFGGGRGNAVFAMLFGLVLIFAYVAGLAFCVYFALRYAVSVPVLMIENLGVFASIRRSVSLTRGRRGQIFLSLLVAGIIAAAGTYVLQGPFMVATILAAVQGHWPSWLAFASAVAGAIGSALTGPVSMIAIVLLYYDSRIRKEAFDLQFMMASLDNPIPAAGTVSPA